MMPVEVKDLLAGTRIADKDGITTEVLVEIIQRLVKKTRDLEARLAALEP